MPPVSPPSRRSHLVSERDSVVFILLGEIPRVPGVLLLAEHIRKGAGTQTGTSWVHAVTRQWQPAVLAAGCHQDAQEDIPRSAFMPYLYLTVVS